MWQRIWGHIREEYARKSTEESFRRNFFSEEDILKVSCLFHYTSNVDAYEDDKFEEPEIIENDDPSPGP